MDLLGDPRAKRLPKEQKEVAGPPKTSQNIREEKGPSQMRTRFKVGHGHWLSH